MNIQEEEEKPSVIKDNDYAILYESEKNIKLVRLMAGEKYQTTQAAYRHINMVGSEWGSAVSSFNKPHKQIIPIKPKSTLITDTLPRKTQILYSMDNSAIVFKLDLKVGDVVVEAGTGSGSLSCAISETIGDKGHLYTFQFNKERAEITGQFFQALHKHNITSTWRDVVEGGFTMEDHPYQADALFLDVPNPWAAINHAKVVLKKYGRICCFSPCIEQVQKTVQSLKKAKFKNLETIECISREFQTGKQITLESLEGPKRMYSCTRAVQTNRGHTGYLTFAVSC